MYLSVRNGAKQNPQTQRSQTCEKTGRNNHPTSAGTLWRPSLIGDGGVFTVFQIFFQSHRALKGQKVLRRALSLPGWESYVGGEGTGRRAAAQKALMQRTVGSLPNLTFSTGGLQLHPNRLHYRLPMGIATKWYLYSQEYIC